MSSYILTPLDAIEIKGFYDKITEAIEQDRLLEYVVETAYGSNNILPDQVVSIVKSINEAKENPYDDSTGVKVLRTLFKGTKATGKYAIDGVLKDPTIASRFLRALKLKLKNAEDMEARAKANQRGFFATVVYTIKKAILWLVNKFRDLKDTVLDAIEDKQPGYHQARRDYQDLHSLTLRAASRNADWLISDES